MAFADMKDKSIPTTFQQNVAATDPAFVKSFQNFDLDNPHPGYGKDPNIINHYGHTLYPKMLYPNGNELPGVIVNSEEEENEVLGVKVELKENGPTVAEYVAAGYKADTYPPKGYASKSSPEEIKKAIEKQSKQSASW